MPAVFNIFTDLDGWLISGAAANNVSGTALDLRTCQPWAIAQVKCTGNSAIVDLMYSPNGTDWATAITYTATNGGTAYSQISAFYPYIKAATRLVYSAAGGSARAYVYYRAGMGA